MAESTTESITEKLKVLIATADEWAKKMTDAAKLQNGIFTETHLIATQLQESLEQNIKVAQQLVDKFGSVGDEAAKIRSQWQATTSAAATPYDPKLLFGLNQIEAIGTIQQKAAMEWSDKRVKEIYEVMAQIEDLQNNRGTTPTGIGMKDYLAWMRAREVEERFRTAEQKAAVDKYEAARKADEAQLALLLARYKELETDIHNNPSSTYAQLDQEQANKNLAAEAVLVANEQKAKEAETYTPDELAKLLNDAVQKTNNSYLINLLAKVNLDKKFSPTKTYQLDLTVGDKKLTAYTDTSPEAFLNALINAKMSSIYG